MIARIHRTFTLLELLVVIAILAIVGGGLLLSYDGLEEKAAQGQAVYTLAGLDGSIRTFKVLNNEFPDGWDSLLVADTTGADTVLLDDQSFSNGELVDFPIGLQDSELLLEETVGRSAQEVHNGSTRDGHWRCGTCGAKLLFVEK